MDTVGYPNGMDNWSYEDIFRRDYLIGNDLRFLLGSKDQLPRYLDDRRYGIDPGEYVSHYVKDKKALDEIIGKLVN